MKGFTYYDNSAPFDINNRKVMFQCIASNISEADAKFFAHSGINLADGKIANKHPHIGITIK